MHPYLHDYLTLPGIVTSIGMLLNLAWSALNLKMQASLREQMRRNFVLRTECEGTTKLVDERHTETCRRLGLLENCMLMAPPAPPPAGHGKRG